MAILSVRGPGTTLVARQGQFVVLRGQDQVHASRMRDVTEVQCHGPVEVAASARAAMLARGVPAVFLTLDGRYRGRLDGPRSPSGDLQIAQTRLLADPAARLSLAKDIVRGKVLSQRSLILQQQRSRRSPMLASVAARMRAALGQLDRAPDLNAVRGVEGRAADIYFDSWRELVIPEEMAWICRTRRPPRDPVNACLSYGYTLLLSRVEGAVLATGLLAGAGALHEGTRGHPALALDLVEEFRAPVVDRLVLRLVNRRQLVPEDFEDPSARPPFLSPAPEVAANEAPPPLVEGDAGGEGGCRDDVPARCDGTEAGAGPGEAAPSPDEDDLPPPDPAPRHPGACWLASTGRAVFQREFALATRADLTDADDGSRIRIDWLPLRQARRLARVFRGTDEHYRPLAWS